MKNLKAIGTIFASTAILTSMVAAPSASANFVNHQQQKVQITVASTETNVTKNELIQRVHKLFPNRFSFVSNNDFHNSSASFYTNDEELRYHLHFSKNINGKSVHGSFVFKGENLEIEQFSYQPVTEKDSMFPAKVSKDEARQIATNFMGTFANGEKYVIEPNAMNYYSPQLLTEPIRYSFTFAQTKNDIPISDKQINVTVQGNGEVVGFYRMSNSAEYPTFDDKNNIKDEQQALAQIKDNLAVDLQYLVSMDYRTEKPIVSLIYQPASTYAGVHALTGKWQTTNGLLTQLPAKTKIEKLATSPLPAKYNGITVEQAKEMAQKLLAIDSKQVKLVIQSVDEVEREGKKYLSVSYMYQSKSFGSGGSLEFNKQTGEITQYYNNKSNFVMETSEQEKPALKITKDQALESAIKYLKEYAPTYLHHYAKPAIEPYVEEHTDGFNFTFPRVVNGLLVSGDQVMVGIAADGSLSNLYIGYQNIDEWPAITAAVPVEDVEKKLREDLTVKLNYVQQTQKDKVVHYNLLYSPIFNTNSGAYIDATTGEWKNGIYSSEEVVVNHPTAQQELNYLINAKILEVKDVAKFNGNEKVSQGEALKVIIKSLTYFYEGLMGDRGEMKQSFTNISPDHPLYSVVERAVSMGIIKVDGAEFNTEAKITREELAVWYMHTLGLEPAAKHSEIYQLEFEDAADVNPKYIGYVAVANAMGILPVDKNRFNPNSEITYADLAVSTIRLAYELAEKRTNNYY
ncbi:YcdB/YcdC domain-containing protein [Solibacillus sp. FSL R7-0682]|uniref:YcdB/YcdC domain-containing protein n=1 Tax=Solibacillus sp. FSL R7-0682 TaxID=2921690 RepID=UPI0030FB4738